MGTVRRSILRRCVHDVERGLQLLLDDREVHLHLEVLDRPGRLELVDEDHLLATLGQAVERSLLDVTLERASDVTPDRVPVGPLLLGNLILVRNLDGLGVLADQLRRGVADGPLADRLDLDERVLLDRDVGAEVEVTVALAVDVVRLQTNRDLGVLQARARRGAVGTARG
ncbi:MAG: hypothetical protein ABR616_15765 [Dermatophilaceae bacterium]|nr:hypothetical protein [Intrasporangiaceae bacterium]